MNEEIVLGGNMAFKEWSDYYFEKYDHDKNSFSTYVMKHSFDKYVFSYIGSKSLREINNDDIENIVRNCRLTLSHNSAWAIFTKIRRMFNKAIELGLVSENPCSHLNSFRYKPGRRYTYSEDELQKLKEATDKSKYADLYRLSFASGMKLSELLPLCWNDVDLDKNFICVSKCICRSSRPERYLELSHKRYYMIDHGIKKILEDIKETQERCSINNPHNLLFPGNDGEYLKMLKIDAENRRISEMTGIKLSFRTISTHVNETRNDIRRTGKNE